MVTCGKRAVEGVTGGRRSLPGTGPDGCAVRSEESRDRNSSVA